MRIRTVSSKNTLHYAIIKDISRNGKRTTKVVENLRTIEKIKERSGQQDPLEWLEEYLLQLNEDESQGKLPVNLQLAPNLLIKSNTQRYAEGGYLFLEKIFYQLGLHTICQTISKRYKFNYNLTEILSCLVFSRILSPGSKLKNVQHFKSYLEPLSIDYHDVLRALEVLAKENDFIQSQLYKNSLKHRTRNDGVLFYDCTNYFFYINEEDDLRRFGINKQHQPRPQVQMGLFLDGDGLPLAFSIFPGNESEQTSLKPLEQKIINDFNHSKFVVCTDAGLASSANRRFNDTPTRRFITTQSIKKLKTYLKEWSLDLENGWRLPHQSQQYNLSQLRTNPTLIETYYDKTFYKERWINENGIEQRLIITYSVRYQEYQERVRENQCQRAMKLIKSNPKKIGKPRQNDFKRFIKETSITEQGEVANQTCYLLDQQAIETEARFDGIYGICTNLEDDIKEIIKINKGRWEIEESFMILKSEFEAQPIHLSREDRIKAHFMTCFISLFIFRVLEKELDTQASFYEILETLQQFNFLHIPDEGYIPTFTRTKLTDELHGFLKHRLDTEIVTYKKFKEISKKIKK